MYASFWLALIPLLIAGLNVQRRRNVKVAVTNSQLTKLAPKHLLMNVIHFWIIVPALCLLSLLLSLGMTSLTNWQAVNKMTFIVLIFPLLWGLLAYWYLYSERRVVSTALIITATSVIGFSLFLSQ